MTKFNFKRYSKRFLELGPTGTINAIKRRIKKNFFIAKFLYKSKKINKKDLLNIKKKIKCEFVLFGKKVEFNKIPNWQIDFKTEKIAKTWGDDLLLYSKIKIENYQSNGIDEYNPDIKVPWELSRFLHFYEISKKFKKNKNSVLVEEFENQTLNWIYQNPFPFGVNWVCPMEVAIRSINWILIFETFKDTEIITTKFKKKFEESLEEHMLYLENNWEESDKPNNHYIADLIGYLYLAIFFKKNKKSKQKLNWSIKKLLEQFKLQVFDEGSSYEGSTSYHRLVTEIFWHFKILCEQNKIKLSKSFYSKINKMFLFIENCTDNAGNFVQIGDNDSGKITKIAISNKKLNKNHKENGVFHYKNFGLTIIKKNGWHITFRHPTYKKQQPSGHFHQDDLSITVSIGGIPILVDPGTFVYTANNFARNYFRSYESHNTVYSLHEDLINLNKSCDLFQLEKKENSDSAKIHQCRDKTVISNSRQNIKRKIIFDSKNQLLEIIDQLPTNNIKNKNLFFVWNFIFHPDIEIIKEMTCWKIFKNNIEILSILSNLELEKRETFYSPRYGKKEKCIKLRGAIHINKMKRFKTIFLKKNKFKKMTK